MFYVNAERRNRQMQNMNVNAERRNPQMQNMNVNAMVNNGQWQPQTGSYSFQSSTVTYGGQNGNYYTSSKTRRTGSDGVSYISNVCVCKDVSLCLLLKLVLL